MEKYAVEIEEDVLKVSLDSNMDGENVADIRVFLPEAVQEILKKGEKIEGAKVVDFEFGLGGIKLVLDTDQDGEKLLELNLNFAEAIDESGLMK